MNYSDIKSEIIDKWEEFASNQHPYELLNEFAESAVPVYYNQIISDWQEMPSEFDNVWSEEGYTSESITALMSYDLSNYYRHQYHRIYSEVAQDMEALEEEELTK